MRTGMGVEGWAIAAELEGSQDGKRPQRKVLLHLSF